MFIGIIKNNTNKFIIHKYKKVIEGLYVRP